MTSVSDLVIDYLPNGSLSVSFPYDPFLVQLIRAMPGRRWHKEQKQWSIPRTSLRTLQEQAGRKGVGVSLSTKVRQALNLGRLESQKLLEAKANESPFEIESPTTPYGFQYAGVRYAKHALHNFKGALIGDDQGLGKTFEALSIVAMHEKIVTVLVLCPATLKYTWAEQIAEHFPQLSYTVIDGGPKLRREQWSAETRLKIVNYDLLLRDPEPRILTWDLIIADEVGTMLKNYKAQRTKRTKKLKRRYALALSGIPLENKLEELHSVMDFVIPGLLGPGWLFVQQHVVKDWWGRTVGYRGLEAVKERIAPYYIRRTKKEVLPELPDKIYNDVSIEMSVAEWDLYNIIRTQIREKIRDNPKLSASNILVELLRLKQAADDPRLLDEESTPSSKIAALKDIIEASEGHPIVAFTQFATLASLLGEDLDTPVIRGSVKPEERQRIINEFQDGQHSVLISTDAGAYGITLTWADIVVHIDSAYNPAKMRQREDRLHRIGQKNAVQVVNLICRRTVDEHVRKILHKKLDLIRNVLDEDVPDLETPNITKEDLLELLGDD